MFRVFVSCDDRLDPSSRVLLLSSVASSAAVVSPVAVALKALSRLHLR